MYRIKTERVLADAKTDEDAVSAIRKVMYGVFGGASFAEEREGNTINYYAKTQTFDLGPNDLRRIQMALVEHRLMMSLAVKAGKPAFIFELP